ncbi:MAG: amidohydrolase family protein [Pseudomonadota bacterium]
MSYISGRVVHDADAHVMETPGWLKPFATAEIARKLEARFPAMAERLEIMEKAIAMHDDADYRAKDEQEIMARKNHAATGAFRREDRPAALDYIGVASQLVFPTSSNVQLEQLEHEDDLDLLYGTASATNRSQVDFCSVDSRLLPVGYVPLADTERSPGAAKEALELGCKALLIPWACPKNHATSHIGFDGIWAQAQEAGVPVLFHVGAADFVLPKSHSNNGLPYEKDFHGGDENFRSVSYMAIPSGPQQALSLLILDGVLDRFPELKFGVIELGAVWVPSYIRQLEAAFEAFARHESRLQQLALRPAEYIQRQVRVTPYPTEPTGWIIEQSAPEICMFSSDYPHVEGGRNPMGRFERTTEGLSEEVREKFFRTNFEDMMGPGMAQVPISEAA